MGHTGLLEQGIYDGGEVARLVKRSPSTIAGWTTPRLGQPAILEPSLGDLFSFLNLISLYVVSELRRRGVRRDHIVHGARYLAERLGTQHPFAHEGLATVGQSFFAEVGPWVDVGFGGQQAFQEVIRPLIRPITFKHHLAAEWRPADKVLLSPRIQAGTPCVEGTRVPTAVLYSLIARESADRIADDLRLTLDQVAAAVRYEMQLED